MAAVPIVTPVRFPPELNDFEGWVETKRILVILAHPDDPEFFCGATLIRWAKLGHEIHYCLITTGQKGSQKQEVNPEGIAKIRMMEQQEAAKFIGVKSVKFLDYIDGELFPDLQMREDLVSVIRRYTPQIIVTSDPQNYVSLENRLNHPDHRAAGEVVLGAAFPAAGNAQFVVPGNEHPNSHLVQIEEVWLSATNQPNLVIDISDYFEQKLAAISCHRSQIGDQAEFVKRMRSRFYQEPDSGKNLYIERFKRTILR
jgi:LmbE family N-acetylglucosaminyl deacetylase